jgi:hypothetical protein
MPLPLDGPGPDHPPLESEMDGFWAIRRRWRWMWLLFFTWLPAIAVASSIHHRLELVVAIGWLVGWLFAGTLHAWSQCPRCGKRAFQNLPLWTNPWSRRCLHCETRLYWADEELGPPGSPVRSRDR